MAGDDFLYEFVTMGWVTLIALTAALFITRGRHMSIYFGMLLLGSLSLYVCSAEAIRAFGPEQFVVYYSNACLICLFFNIVALLIITYLKLVMISWVQVSEATKDRLLGAMSFLQYTLDLVGYVVSIWGLMVFMWGCVNDRVGSANFLADAGMIFLAISTNIIGVVILKVTLPEVLAALPVRAPRVERLLTGNGSDHLRCEAYFKTSKGKSCIVDCGKIIGTTNGNVTIQFDDGVTQTIPESWVTWRAPSRVLAGASVSGNDEAIRLARAAQQAAEERARRAEEDRREAEKRARQATQNQSNHYELLGLQPGCSADDIHKAYKKLVLIAHPDKNDKAGSAQAATSAWFRSVQQAYEVLKDPLKRQQYDEQQGLKPTPHSSTKVFHKGDLVNISGLQQNPEYNNRQGEVVEDAIPQSRVRVQVLLKGEVKQLDLKPENLTSV